MAPFLAARAEYAPRVPKSLEDLARVGFVPGENLAPLCPPSQEAELKALLPNTWGHPTLELAATNARDKLASLKVGVVLSGGPAPGGHNVLWGLWEGLKQLAEKPSLIGFKSGPGGILKDDFRVLDDETLAPYRNAGGFDCIGTGRTKIETAEQLARCREVLAARDLDALVIVGGDDSNTNAAIMAEDFAKAGARTAVIGVPKTIDGDLRNDFVATSFGFDTAARVYAELIANVGRDVLSTRKYYHFIRLMGRSASHITLEAALQTQPNVAFISEELAARKTTLRGLVDEMAELCCRRADASRDYGLVLVPEGVIEFLPEFKLLIKELNEILAGHKQFVATLSGFTAQSEYVHRKLSKEASYTFSTLPIDIQRQLLMDRDPHGNVVVSRIETEKLLIEMLQSRLAELKAEGRYRGNFGWQAHFFGYEGRCAAPTNFDADYAFSLGRTAAALAAEGASGYMAAIAWLDGERGQWRPVGVPLSALMTIEHRHGKPKAVIRKALVELDGAAFQHFAGKRAAWAEGDHYLFAGPIQYFGPDSLTSRIPCSLLGANPQEMGSSKA